MKRPKLRIIEPPATRQSCGHLGQPHWHNENGKKRSGPLCQLCHEDDLRRAMRLELSTEVKGRAE